MNKHPEVLRMEQKIRQVAHDIRSPLTVLYIFLEQAESSLNDEQLKKLSEAAKRSIKKLNDFADSLRREEAVITQPEYEEHDVAQMLRQTVEEIKTVAKTKDIEIEYVGPITLSAIFDKKLMNRVITNFISNALQATTPGIGSIRVGLFYRDDSVIIDVADNGSGIPQEHLRKIFESGFTHGKHNGTGLGLDICKQIVEGHGGKIQVYSQETIGTIFTMRLPLTVTVYPEIRNYERTDTLE